MCVRGGGLAMEVRGHEAATGMSERGSCVDTCGGGARAKALG